MGYFCGYKCQREYNSIADLKGGEDKMAITEVDIEEDEEQMATGDGDPDESDN